VVGAGAADSLGLSVGLDNNSLPALLVDAAGAPKENVGVVVVDDDD
jgi:hypothetical protein